MKNNCKIILIVACCSLIFDDVFSQMIKIRPLADTVGFAHTKLQMDSVVTRINRIQGNDLKASRLNAGIDKNTSFKTVISPHDDYTYTGYLYSLALENIKAKTVIIFGVAHKAKVFKVEDKLVFDSYSHWRSPYGNIPVSALRSDIIAKLPPGSFLINDSLQKAEHSVEAEIPFLHYYNKNVEIISILIPAMNYEKMNTLCVALAKSIAQVMKIKNLKWGADLAFVISNDAVHYGNEGWGGKDLALYGVDSSGYIKAVEHEYDILNSCMKGTADTSKIRLFTEFTLQKENYKEYKWAWCGRYSVPAGMLTSVYLARELKLPPVKGIILGYGTSIGNKHIKVDDLQGLGVTAVANLRHWVGYAAIGFK